MEQKEQNRILNTNAVKKEDNGVRICQQICPNKT